jgi:hypothetical protein
VGEMTQTLYAHMTKIKIKKKEKKKRLAGVANIKGSNTTLLMCCLFVGKDNIVFLVCDCVGT